MLGGGIEILPEQREDGGGDFFCIAMARRNVLVDPLHGAAAWMGIGGLQIGDGGWVIEIFESVHDDHALGFECANAVDGTMQVGFGHQAGRASDSEPAAGIE